MVNESYSPIRLRVEKIDIKDAGRGIVRINPDLIELMHLDIGSVIGIKGNRTTCARVMILPAQHRQSSIIQMDDILIGNAQTTRGAEVEVFCVDAKKASTIIFAEDGCSVGISKKPGCEYVHKMLKSHCVCAGDYASVPHFGSTKYLIRVCGTIPDGFVTVDDNTKTIFKDEECGAETGDFIGYKDIGGLDVQIKKIREIIEYPVIYSEMFKTLNLEPSKGILLYGPPGTGKTLIAKAIANEVSAKFITINGPEIINKYYGESEAKLREIFEDAKNDSPSIVFIDEIDAIAPKREEVQGDVEKRIVAQLLSLMDGVKDRSNVVVIGATNLPNSIDPALRRPGRFDREIYIGVPDENARVQILKVHTRKIPLSDDIDINSIAAKTHGYVGADLSSLCKEASMNCIRRYFAEHPVCEGGLPTDFKNIKVSKSDFLLAFNEVPPSAIREVMVEVPHVTWDMIGGLKSIKARLRESIEWPLKYPGIFSAMKLKSPRGILLYGPPGTGKTLVARAIATESGANFISIKGPELLSKWQGETEKGIREMFKKAKQTSPCIVFFDEIDSLTAIGEQSVCGQSSSTAQFLTEMDGIESLENVIVVGATNRVDAIDKALLRDGRFDIMMKFNLPNSSERKEIFTLHLKDKPLDSTVDLIKLVEMTDGFSGAEIGGACRRAAFLAIRSFLKENGEEWKDVCSLRINQKDLETALTNRMEEF